MASKFTGVSNVYSTIYRGVDQRKQQSSASLAFVWGIHQWPLNSSHKGPVTRKMFLLDDVIISWTVWNCSNHHIIHWSRYMCPLVDVSRMNADGHKSSSSINTIQLTTISDQVPHPTVKWVTIDMLIYLQLGFLVSLFIYLVAYWVPCCQSFQSFSQHIITK